MKLHDQMYDLCKFEGHSGLRLLDKRSLSTALSRTLQLPDIYFSGPKDFKSMYAQLFQ